MIERSRCEVRFDDGVVSATERAGWDSLALSCQGMDVFIAARRPPPAGTSALLIILTTQYVLRVIDRQWPGMHLLVNSSLVSPLIMPTPEERGEVTEQGLGSWLRPFALTTFSR